jgi:hypothetical protein
MYFLVNFLLPPWYTSCVHILFYFLMKFLLLIKNKIDVKTSSSM